jgi:hypothetical protein
MTVVRALFHALSARCPHCGAGGLRAGAMRLVPACPRCRFRFDRGETDAFLGGYTVNLLGALIVGAAFAVVALGFGDLPRPILYAMGIGAIVAFAFGFYPISRLVWLAADLAFRPAQAKDFVPPAEPAARAAITPVAPPREPPGS